MSNPGEWSSPYQTFEIHFAPEFHFGEWARYRDMEGATAFLSDKAESIAESLRERGLRVLIQEPAHKQLEPRYREAGL